MKRIVTVKGAVDAADFGFCQSHEHIWLAKGYPAAVAPSQRIDDGEKSRDELRRYYAAGGRALVDAQPPGCGRDAEVLRRLSKESGVHIVASTGFHKMLFYPETHWIFRWDEDRLARFFIAELCTGMSPLCDTAEPGEGTGVRAGQIKTALDAGPFTKQYEKLFSAAANAAAESGAPFMAHIEETGDPVGLADRLERQGIPAEKTIFCHLDRSVRDLGVHRELCRRGIYLEYDTVARPKYHSDEHEISILLKMLAYGFERRILMSLDTTRDRLRAYGCSDAPGLTYIRTVFLEKLRDAGITREQEDLLFVQNPARAFSVER